ncbi:MAG: hypothetical protein ABIR57_01965, partial [Aeromicrobium sp.]
MTSEASQRVCFPAGTHYAVTTGFGTDFMGLTTAMLVRSRSFVEQTGQPITILTHARDDYDQVRAELTDRGFLIPGMTLINLFEDVRTWDDAKTRRILKLQPLVLPVPGPCLGEDDPDVNVEKYCRTKFVGDAVTQVDHLRE